MMRAFGDTEARLMQGTLDFGLGLFSSLPDSLRRQEVWSDPYAKCSQGQITIFSKWPQSIVSISLVVVY
jgi:hypothetical protein